MRRLALVLALALLLVGAVSALDGYDYYQEIGYNATDVATYQQDVVVHRSTGTDYEETAGGLKIWHIYVGDHCREDYGDARFTNSTGAELAYYLWPDYSSESARFCVLLEGATSAGALTVHYGNPAAETTSLPIPLTQKYTVVGAHTYTVPLGVTSVAVLVVAGGGGGGGQTGGGGGAGGLVHVESVPVVPGSAISVSVGNGGNGGVNGANGANGAGSSFGLISAIGGGGGGNNAAVGANGGSGGGSGTGVGTHSTGVQPLQSGDSGTYGHGHDGAGYVTASPYWGSSGGGGASAAGGAGTSYAGGNGGAGMYIWGAAYAGGGGGGTYKGGTLGVGGVGGGGNGGGYAGTANTGGGGGGQRDNLMAAAGAGGSGIVVVCIGVPWSAAPPSATTFSSEQQPPAPPTAQFVATPTLGARPLTVQFTDTSTCSPTSWSWTFGDGTTSTAQSPTHTYTEVGTYTVSLTATNAYGTDSETKTNYIDVGDPPAASFTPNPSRGYAPLTVQFTDTSTCSPTSWSWTFGDGTTSTAQSPTHTYTEVGTYTVSLTATNAYGQDSATTTVTASTIYPFPGITANPTDIDADGIYEDINGNGRLDFNDLTIFFKNLAWAKTNEPVEAFDFNGNGWLDYKDVTLLFNEIKEASA